MTPVYRRILLKLSGEALAGSKGFGIDTDCVMEICRSIKEVVNLGVQVGIVVGGGNFWRGRSNSNMDRTRADHIGMLATAMNSLALGDALDYLEVPNRVQTSIEMNKIAEPYIRNRAIRHFEKGRVVIFGCGTGNPYFSTDTAAALKAAEIEADVILKATKVDGVYDSDPATNPDAVKFDTITYLDVLNRGLAVMDSTATSLSMDNSIPIIVFNLDSPSNIVAAVLGKDIGTTVKN